MNYDLAMRVEQQLSLESRGMSAMIDNIGRVDTDGFRKILKLELAEPCRENVLEAI